MDEMNRIENQETETALAKSTSNYPDDTCASTETASHKRTGIVAAIVAAGTAAVAVGTVAAVKKIKKHRKEWKAFKQALADGTLTIDEEETVEVETEETKDC